MHAACPLSSRAQSVVGVVALALFVATATATVSRPRTIAAAVFEPTSVTVQPDQAVLAGSVQVEIAAGNTRAVRLWLQGWPGDLSTDDLRAHVNASADAAATCSVVGTRVGQLVPARQLECMLNVTERFAAADGDLASSARGNVAAFASPLMDAKCPDDKGLKVMMDELREQQEAISRNVSAVDEQLQRVADSAALLERAKDVYFQLPSPAGHSPRGPPSPRVTGDAAPPSQVPPPSLTELLEGVNQVDAARAKNADRRRDLLAERQALVKAKSGIIAAFAALGRKSSVVEVELQCTSPAAPHPLTPQPTKHRANDDDDDNDAEADHEAPRNRRSSSRSTKGLKKLPRIEVVFEVTTRQASWRPSYDLRLDSAGTQHELDFLADVQQWTGHDWTNVSLTVTTAQVSRGSDAALPPVPRLVAMRREAVPVDYLRRARKEHRPRMDHHRKMKQMSESEAQRARGHMDDAEADEGMMDAGGAAAASASVASFAARGGGGDARVYGATDDLAPVLETGSAPESPPSSTSEAAPAKSPSWSAGNVFATTLQHRADVPSGLGHSAAAGATVPVALSLRVQGTLALVAHPDVSTAVFQRANLSNVEPDGISLLSGRSRIYVDGNYAADGTLPALPAGGASVDLDVGKVRGLLVRRTTLADETAIVKTGLLGLGDAMRRSTQRRRVAIVNEGFRVDHYQRSNAAPPDVLVRVAVPVARIPKLVVSTPGAVRGCASADAPERSDDDGGDDDGADKQSVAANKQAQREASRAQCVQAARYAGFVPDAPTGGKHPAAVEQLETYLSIPLRRASDDDDAAGANLEGTPSARTYEVLLESPASVGDDIVVVSPGDE